MSASSDLKSLLQPGFAGSLAVMFTNPLEMTKVRLQLDNELQTKGNKRRYTGFLDCIRKTWNHSGIYGTQKGLSVAIAREFLFNMIRIGLYDPMLLVFAMSKRDQQLSTFERFGAGVSVGALAGAVINPIEIIKTRVQVSGGLTGHQHKIGESIFSAIRSINKNEGLRGFTKGIEVQTLRGFLGPGTQVFPIIFPKEL